VGRALTIANIASDTFLTVTDLTTGQTNTVALATLTGDNSGFGTPSGFTCVNRINEAPVNPPDTCGVGNPQSFLSGYGAQNSENPTFGNFPLTGYNPNAANDYAFTLSVGDGSLLASDTIDVDVAPEPFLLYPLAGIAALLVVFSRRRRRLTA